MRAQEAALLLDAPLRYASYGAEPPSEAQMSDTAPAHLMLD